MVCTKDKMEVFLEQEARMCVVINETIYYTNDSILNSLQEQECTFKFKQSQEYDSCTYIISKFYQWYELLISPTGPFLTEA